MNLTNDKMTIEQALEFTKNYTNGYKIEKFAWSAIIAMMVMANEIESLRACIIELENINRERRDIQTDK